ncbi:MAG TPA: DUF4142 domain-containing protein [Polyangiales bacterium]|nr:DUF4142 domain-containing protein [Polyangiales bacterium]
MSLSLVVIGALCGACDDADDPASTSDEQSQADAGAETDKPSQRAGSSASARAGRGGSNAASTNNNSAAGRAGAGQAGRTSPAASGGAGAAGTQAGNGGAAGAIDPERVSLSDGQIVAVLAAVNASEISMGTLAMTRGVEPGVRNHGESMATVHNTAQERQNKLAMSLDLKSEVSPLSTQLGDDAKNLMAELEAADAAEFDALYLRSQVDGHMKVLMLLSERLIPSVMAEELRTELMLVRMEVATHLEGARNASTALEDTDAGTL